MEPTYKCVGSFQIEGWTAVYHPVIEEYTNTIL